MKMIIQTPDFKISKELNEFVKKHVEKLELYSDRILESRVLLKLDNSEIKENKVCELRLAIPGNDLFSIKQSSSFEESLVMAVEAIKPQLIRWKDTKIKRGRRPAAPTL